MSFAAPHFGAPWTSRPCSQQRYLTRGKGERWNSLPYTGCHLTTRNDFLSDPPAVPRLRRTARRSFSSRCAMQTVSRPAGSLQFNLRRRRYAVPANGCLVTLMRWPNPNGSIPDHRSAAAAEQPPVILQGTRFTRCGRRVFPLDKPLSWMSFAKNRSDRKPSSIRALANEIIRLRAR